MEDAYGEEDGWRRTAAIVCPVHVEASASALQLEKIPIAGWKYQSEHHHLCSRCFDKRLKGRGRARRGRRR